MKDEQDDGRLKDNDVVECAVGDVDPTDTRCKVSCAYLVTLTKDGTSSGESFCSVWGSEPQQPLEDLEKKFCYVDGQYIPEGNTTTDTEFEYLFATETDSECATWAELFDKESLAETGDANSKWHADGKNRWSKRDPDPKKYPTKYNCVYECCENWNKPICDEFALFKYMKNAQHFADIYQHDTLPLCGEIWMGKFNSRMAFTKGEGETLSSWAAEIRTNKDSAFAKAITKQCRPHCDWQFYWSEGCSWANPTPEPVNFDKTRSSMFPGIFNPDPSFNSDTPDHACEYSRLDLLCDTFCRDDLWDGHPPNGPDHHTNDEWQCHMHDHWLFEPTNLMIPKFKEKPELDTHDADVAASNPWKPMTNMEAAKRGENFEDGLRKEMISDDDVAPEFMHLMTTTFQNYYQDWDKCVAPSDGRTAPGGRPLSEGYQKYVKWSCQSHQNIFESLLENCPRIMSFQQRLLPHNTANGWGFTDAESSGIKNCLCSCCKKFQGNNDGEYIDPKKPRDGPGFGTSSDVPQGSKCWNQNKWFDPPSDDPEHKIRFSRFEVGARDYVAFLFSRPHDRYDDFRDVSPFKELNDQEKTGSTAQVGENTCTDFQCLGWTGVKALDGDGDKGIKRLKQLLFDDFRTDTDYCTEPNDNDEDINKKRCAQPVDPAKLVPAV